MFNQRIPDAYRYARAAIESEGEIKQDQTPQLSRFQEIVRSLDLGTLWFHLQLPLAILIVVPIFVFWCIREFNPPHELPDPEVIPVKQEFNPGRKIPASPRYPAR